VRADVLITFDSGPSGSFGVKLVLGHMLELKLTGLGLGYGFRVMMVRSEG